MLTDARIMIEELKDDYARSSGDFTPDHLRVWPHLLTLEARVPALVDALPGTTSGLRVTLAESDYATPDYLYIGLYIDKPAGYDSRAFLEGTLSVEQLDAAIEALTLARDTAICEGLIAPARDIT